MGNSELNPDQGALRPRWGNPRPSHPRPNTYRYLLDLDVDLAEELDRGLRMVARPSATAMTFEADAGEVSLDQRLKAAAPGPGVLVLDGILAVNVRVGDRIAAELLGPGDLVESDGRSEEELFHRAVDWRALLPMRFAVLDGGFADRVGPWPQIMQALLRRSERRTRNLNVQRAIASQPRLEVRLALLLWHLAARWGKVEPGGIRLPLPLTHQLLGRLVGAERPSVSHALARLARTGLVTGHGDEWHLHGKIEEQLACMAPSDDGAVHPFVRASVEAGRR